MTDYFSEASASGTTPDPGQETDPGSEEAAQFEIDLASLQRERDDLLDTTRRLQADFENYRKRVARDLAAAEDRGVAKLARELLPALDAFARALDSGHLDDEGLRLVQTEFASALARVGIETYSPQGEPFDPNLHDAMAKQPVEGAESGTVAEVYQAGYRINGTVLRPARVVVAE
jgi:molecular chaperone GrpE